MIKIASNKFFNRYLPMFLSVVLIVSAVFFYQISVKPETAKAGFSYYKPLTINHGWVASSTAESYLNFPLLISDTDTALKTVGNGGKVQNASGFDIGYYTNPDCSTGKMAWETESYATSTGAIISWVKVAGLSTSTDTTIYRCYGDASISSDQQNATGTWDSSFKGVWHLKEATGSNNIDSTSNGNTATPALSPTQTSGKIDGSLSFRPEADQYSETSDSGDKLDILGALTYSAWIKATSFTNFPTILSKYRGNGVETSVWFGLNNGDGTMLELSISDSTVNDTIARDYSGALSTNTMYYVVGTYDGGTSSSGIKLYVNGNRVDDANNNLGSFSSIKNVTSPVVIGGESLHLYNFQGIIDEPRISSGTRSSDWIKTEYNNQNSPSTFYTVGSENVIPHFTYSRSITVNGGQVPSTQTNFPMLVAGTYSYLATTGNGGNVQNASGYDVGFYTNSNCSTGKMAWETEKYTATTGAVAYWVKVSSMQNGAVIYMCYGDSAITSDQSNATGVWDANYKGIYHLGNGTSLSAADSTGNFNGTNEAATATTGQIDGGADFNDSAQITTANNSTYGDFTACAWFKTNTNSAGQRIIDKLYTTGFWMGQNATGGFDSWGGGIEQTGSPFGTYVTLAHNSWHMLCNQRSGTLQTITGDGTITATSTVSSAALDGNFIYIGADSCCSALADSFNGQIDQVEISNIARSADWILTEYNNQSSPSSFYAISGESSSSPAGPAKTGNFVQVGGKFRLRGGKIIIR